MRKMRNGVWIAGEHAQAVTELFGDVQITSRSTDSKGLCLTVRAVLPNFYRTSAPTVKTAPLYILVPQDVNIDGVDPHGVGDGMTFGTAERHNGHTELTKIIGIFKGNVGICICLKPLTDEEVKALEVGSLGL